MSAPDPIALAQALIRCPSVTPEDGGALGVLEAALAPLGFRCHRLRFAEPGTAPVENLYARRGETGPNFCFAGHTDVVPPGERKQWTHDPFAGEIRDGVLHGRGAADMKPAIAAFVAAAARHAGARNAGSISLLITGDEEGPAVNGTRKVLAWLRERGETIDHCLVGEPTSAAVAGDTLKIGRRGSLTLRLTVAGVQGHTAYPQHALNPVPILAAIVADIAADPLDRGTAHFEPSTLAFTSFDVGNPASNVIPGEARAVCNIRFNDLHAPAALEARIRAIAERHVRDKGGTLRIEPFLTGTAFLTEPGPFTALIGRAVSSVNGKPPVHSTGGGTSDARFIKDHCPVAELGLPGATMHKANECMPVAEIERLADIYAAILDAYFREPPA